MAKAMRDQARHFQNLEFEPKVHWLSSLARGGVKATVASEGNHRVARSRAALSLGTWTKTSVLAALLILAAVTVGHVRAGTGSKSPADHNSAARVTRTSIAPGTDQFYERSVPTPGGEPQPHGLSQKAEDVVRLLGIPITNSMIVSWFVALCLIIFVQIATRNIKDVPEGAQNLLEWLVESLYNFVAGILGPRLTDRTFWFFGTVFILILTANWAGLLPGIGSVGWGHDTLHGFKVDLPLFRGANADVNMTFAMALVFFVGWIVWSLRELGPIGFLKELFGPKGESAGFLRPLMAFVFFVSGWLEIISILFRPVSLSFRLYGNVFAGENMLETMATLSPKFGWLLQIPFYFLELLMGFVQALVFLLLTAVFLLLMVQHEHSSTPAHA
jgi:F-type H+-transporting ATPase subunit a